MPRFAGIATFMRLPGRSHLTELDAAIVGVPFDIGTSNRPGARFGPRGIRDESVLIRPYNMATRAAPFDSLRIDDTGDVATNPYNLLDSVARIEAHFNGMLSHGVITVALGGDHTIVLPILRAMRARHGPVGLVHVDAPHRHQRRDVRRAHRPRHPVPPGSGGGPARLLAGGPDRDAGHRPTPPKTSTGRASRASGWCRSRSAGTARWPPLMDEGARAGRRRTGISELRHRRSRPFVRSRHRHPPRSAVSPRPRPLEIIRGCRGLDLVGCDMVEVAPIYDTSGMTAHIAADLVYEMLCVLPGVEYRT